MVASKRLAIHKKLENAHSAQLASFLKRATFGVDVAIKRNIQLFAIPMKAQPLGFIEAMSDNPKGIIVNVNPVNQLKYFLFVQRIACDKNRSEAMVELKTLITNMLCVIFGPTSLCMVR